MSASWASAYRLEQPTSTATAESISPSLAKAARFSCSTVSSWRVRRISPRRLLHPPRIRAGRLRRRSVDRCRHIVTSLLAALDVATGKVIGQCLRRHRSDDFAKFLCHFDKTIEKGPGEEIHLIMDNFATHKTAAVKRWITGHPEYHVHFTPDASGWLK
ncbi:transposase [Posidoniimonas polymericola]|uniref:transposase n=1 Tax=Posidoniimonas polymericola TaxID=2528002 RepID=UPI0011B70E97